MFEHDVNRKLKLLGWGLHGLGLAIVLATAGIGYALVLRPLGAGIEECDTRNDQLQRVLASAEKIRAEHRRLGQALAAVKERTAALEQKVPEEPLEAEFLSQVAQAAAKAGLQIRDYRPGVVATRPTHSQMEIQLSCQGTYRSLCEFLDRLAALPRLTRVEKMEITAAGPESQPTTLSLIVYFRLRKAPPPQQTGTSTPDARQGGEKHA